MRIPGLWPGPRRFINMVRHLESEMMSMVNKGHQLRTKRAVERLITGNHRMPLVRIEKELALLGFTELGADPIAVAFEHKPHELYLEIYLDDARAIHSYLLVTFNEKNKKQRKFRW
jgi:hypothetical protein